MDGASSLRPPRLQPRGVTKQYASLLANDAIDLTVKPGEIHALLGGTIITSFHPALNSRSTWRSRQRNDWASGWC